MERSTLKHHPIQALYIAPKELHIRTHVPPTLSLVYDGTDFDLDVGHSDYFPDEKRIQISTRVRIGTPEPEVDAEGGIKGNPFFLNVELVGMFEVDDSQFQAERIYEWATTNAMYIMYPYLREHVFALTSRAGFTPLLMPLVEVPLFKVGKATTEASTPVQASVEADTKASQEHS
jgi:hypothetical protein